MRVVLGTGSVATNNSFEHHFKDHPQIQFVGTVSYKEGVEQIVSREKPDVIILSDKLGGTVPIETIIKKLRTTPPFTRIIFLMTETNEVLKRKLFMYSCFDVIDRNKEKISIEDMENIILNPRKYEDIAHELSDSKSFERNAFDRKYQFENQAINESNYDDLPKSYTSKKPLHQKITSFWSVSDLTGKTFSAVNTALFLANNPDLKILLLDFNIHNPNIHLQFGTFHSTRNLTKLMELFQKEKEMRPHMLREFLIKHPKYQNLSILPGDIIFHLENFSSEQYFQLLLEIINCSSQMNYSTILIDMSSGFTHKLNENILKLSHDVIFHVNECPSSLNAVKYYFDMERGPIISKEIPLDKFYTVINRTTESLYENTKNVLDDLIPNNKNIAYFIESTDIFESVISGKPILSNSNNTLLPQFTEIANVVHPGLFKEITKSSRKIGLFSILK